MTREQCEKEIKRHLKAIAKIHAEYNPNANYLSLSITKVDNELGEWWLSFNNAYWDEDKDFPIKWYGDSD